MPLIDDIRENLKRGILEMLILKLLTKEDMYGYQMKCSLNEISDGLLQIKEGTLYGPLYRLIDKGCVSERKELVGQRRTRVYYHIEEQGREYLELLISEYNAITSNVLKVINGENYE